MKCPNCDRELVRKKETIKVEIPDKKESIQDAEKDNFTSLSCEEYKKLKEPKPMLPLGKPHVFSVGKQPEPKSCGNCGTFELVEGISYYNDCANCDKHFSNWTQQETNDE